MSVRVGQDIESICGKCGDVWHVVFAMDGTKVARVQCKQCGAYHRYRPPGGKGGSRSKSSTAGTRSRARKSAESQPKPRIDEPQVAADLSRPVKEYRFSDDSYQPGDRIEHPKFGTGVVEITSDPGKMQVFFADGRRVLARAKPQSTLARPKPFQHRAPDGGEV